MSRRFLVVICHPVPNSFVRVVSSRAIESLHANGHEVDVIDLDDLQFDPVVGETEWKARDLGVPQALNRHVDALRWATDLVLVYPTWYGGMPALLKGWFDRVWGRGVAWELAAGRAVPRPLLRNIGHIWILTTHGSSKRMNVVQGEAGRQFVRRTLRLTCSPVCRTHWISFYGNDVASDADRRAFLERVGQCFDRVGQRFAKIGGRARIGG
jgi:NAD(P)H dehydrogenase (quinone)